MTKYNRGLAILLIITISFITISSGLYYLGMNYLEDRPRTIIESLEFVTQTMTTVGYGQDPPWKHQLMYLLSMVIQLAGITIVFLSIPIVVTPWIEERITLRPPDEYSGPLNHIIITEYTDLQETFLSELESNDIPYTLLEHDEQKARNLYNQGYNVVLGDAEEPNELVETRAEDARIAILDGTDQRNAAVALAIEDVVPDLETLAIAGNEDRAVHLKAAGADKVIYPRRQIGQVLGHKALSGLGKTVQFEPEQSDATLEIQEFPILKNSQICNKSVRESQIRRKTGAHIIGLWRRGDFISQINPNQMIRKDDVLVTAGTRSQLRDLEQFVQQKTRSRESANVVIIGFGNEGMAAAEVLKDGGIEPTVVNDIDLDGVDIVGNGMDSEILKQANIEEADAIIITISADEAAIMVTLMARELNDHAQILVQVNQSASIESVYRARANYVQSLSQIAGRKLGEEVLGKEIFDPQLNVKIHRESGEIFAGQNLSDLDIGNQYQLSVVAVIRNGELITDFSSDFSFEPDDDFFVAGTDESVKQFMDHHGLQED